MPEVDGGSVQCRRGVLEPQVEDITDVGHSGREAAGLLVLLPAAMVVTCPATVLNEDSRGGLHIQSRPARVLASFLRFQSRSHRWIRITHTVRGASG